MEKAPKYLQEILNYKKIEVNNFKKKHTYSDFEKKICKNQKIIFENALKKQKLSIIAEIKKASPSAGIICENFNPIEIAKTYTEIGVDAISVLTDEHFFKGSIEILKNVRKITDLPILRKDFIIDEIQILEAKSVFADACLLIVAALNFKVLCRFIELCKDIGLSPLVEVHDKDELNIALDAGAHIIGINNRNLETFKLDLNTSKEVSINIPKNIIKVSESGIENNKDIKFIRSLNFDACLIGTSFMKSLNKSKFLKELLNEN